MKLAGQMTILFLLGLLLVFFPACGTESESDAIDDDLLTQEMEAGYDELSIFTSGAMTDEAYDELYTYDDDFDQELNERAVNKISDQVDYNEEKIAENIHTMVVPLSTKPDSGKGGLDSYFESAVYTSKNQPDTNFNYLNYIQVGANNQETKFYAHLAGITCPSEPSNIVEASLWLRTSFSCLSEDMDLYVKRMGGPWDPATITWNNRPTVGLHSDVTTVPQNPNWYITIDATTAVSEICDDHLNNYGIQVNSDNVFVGGYIKLYDEQHEWWYQPKLIITYYSTQGDYCGSTRNIGVNLPISVNTADFTDFYSGTCVDAFGPDVVYAFNATNGTTYFVDVVGEIGRASCRERV